MNVTITVDDRYDLDKVASQVEAAGGQICSRLKTLSILTASVPEESLATVQQIEGVQAVEREETYLTN